MIETHRSTSYLSIKFEHKTQHAVSCRMLWSKIQADVGDFLLHGRLVVTVGWKFPGSREFRWHHNLIFILLVELGIRAPGGSITLRARLRKTKETIRISLVIV